jgi:hypothetical protein
LSLSLNRCERLKGFCWGYLLPSLVFCVIFNIPKFFELESPYNSHHGYVGADFFHLQVSKAIKRATKWVRRGTGNPHGGRCPR